jgi:hypothetical protein
MTDEPNPADPAIAALIAAARVEEREQCASVAAHGCLVPPDGGSPEPWEADLCDEIARRIRALGDE